MLKTLHFLTKCALVVKSVKSSIHPSSQSPNILFRSSSAHSNSILTFPNQDNQDKQDNQDNQDNQDTQHAQDIHDNHDNQENQVRLAYL